MLKNILLTIEYDGSGFHGWQEQRGLRTVQGELQEALSAVYGRDIKIFGTSRTDAGVHALGQRANYTAESGIPTENIATAVNNLLAGGRYGAGSKVPDVRITKAEEVPEEFHARFDCKGKTYRYIIRTGRPNIFNRNYCYYVDGVPDTAAMEEGAKALIGEHDFASFQAAGGTPGKTTVREIQAVEIRGIPCEGDGKEIQIEITGDGFLYNMVRIITGTLLEMGMGKISPSSMRDIILACDRSRAGHTAPPQGLYLKEIYF